jgi:hypothetical protein
MARKAPLNESVPPTLSPQRAIELLRRQLEQFDRVNTLRRDDPEIDKWMHTTEGILNSAFGRPHSKPHEMTARFTDYYGSFLLNMPDSYEEQEHHKGMLQKKAVLESCIEQLELLAPAESESQPTDSKAVEEERGPRR